MEKKKLKGIWIPLEILENKKLSDKEKLLYSIILSLSLDTGYCYANNRYLGKILNITTGRVSKLISSLKAKKFIEIKMIYEDQILIDLNHGKPKIFQEKLHIH